MVQTQFNSNIKMVHTNNGTEYFSNILGSYFKDNGIIHHFSCVNTPKQNGIAERKNRHLLEVAHTFMFQFNVPKHFWGEIILSTNFLINRMPSRVFGFLIPIHVLSQVFPHNRLVYDISFRVFGCTSSVLVHSQNKTILDIGALKTIFLSYSPTQKWYK